MAFIENELGAERIKTRFFLLVVYKKREKAIAKISNFICCFVYSLNCNCNNRCGVVSWKSKFISKSKVRIIGC